MTIHLFIVILAVVCYLLLLNRAMQRGVPGKNIIKAHALFWYPAYLHRLTGFKKLYNDPDLSKVAKAEFSKEAAKLYKRPYFVFAALWSTYFIYTYLAPIFDWVIVRELDFAYRELWPYALIACYVWGTSRANIWANMNLVKAPSKLILEWGELYRKDLLKNALRVQLVEKYWYPLLVRKAFASINGKQYGFMPVPNPDGSLNLEASRLPLVMPFKDGKMEIDTQGFLLPYEVFFKLRKELESYTKLRTVSISNSGKNSVINWQVTHKNLPDQLITYDQVPKSNDPLIQYVAYTGTFWIPIRWRVTKHIAILGNTGRGKSVIMRVLMAGAEPGTLILAGDMGDADAVSFVRLRHDPYQLEALDKRLDAGELIPEYYAYEKEQLDKLPTVVVASNKGEYFRMCQWLNKEFLHRTLACGRYNSVEDVFELQERTGFKFCRIMLFLDEAASAFINVSENDTQVSYIKKTIFDMLVKGRKMDIVVVMATQYASMEALGKARAQMDGIAVYTKGSSIKMLFDEELDIPAPGADGEYTGLSIMQTPDGGIITGKWPFISQGETAKIIYDRSNPPLEKVTTSFANALKSWEDCIEMVEATDTYVPSGKKVTVRRGHEVEEVDA